tara:strand:+ start:12014 stop:12562 length:549 start_codon:yes stop_codon:yes gene_type:complete
MLTNNFVLSKFLGLCPLFGVSKQLSSAKNMAYATILILTITSFLCYIINYYILLNLNLIFLQTIVFITVIAGSVQLLELLIKAISPILYQVLGIYLPLITTNCAVLGLALILSRDTNYSLIEVLIYGFATGIGFGIVLILFAGIREKLEHNDIPEAFKGTSIAMITAGIMALAFMGFTGINL